jgi:hypothetical protein
MEESNIKNKQVLEQAVNEAVASVRQFTKKEIARLLQDPKKQPLIIPVTDTGFIIGSYAIKQYKDLWYVALIYNLDDEVVFQNRFAAIFYALSLKHKNYRLAQELVQYDLDIDRISEKVNRYKHLLKRKPSQQAHAVYASRLQEFEHQLRHKQILLTKSLKMAKYSYL